MWIFEDIFKTTIWGGDRIPALKKVSVDLPNVGESWEISGVAGSESVVAEGKEKGLTLRELVRKYGASLMGEANFEKFGEDFPLLIKFIDARQDLSVQVHPDDALAQKRGFRFGKTEMWYVVDAAPGARLANGFRHEVDPGEYAGLVETGKIEDELRFCPISRGDVFFIPPAGCMPSAKGHSWLRSSRPPTPPIVSTIIIARTPTAVSASSTLPRPSMRSISATLTEKPSTTRLKRTERSMWPILPSSQPM